MRQAILVALVVLAGCHDFKLEPASELHPPLAVELGPNGLAGLRVNALVPEPIVAVVYDGKVPAAGALVTFQVAAGGGRVWDATGARCDLTAVPCKTVTLVTGSDGRAAVRWQLSQRTEANALELVWGSHRETLYAFGMAGDPAGLTIDSGSGQLGVVGAPLANPVIASIVDSFGNRVPGVPFQITDKPADSVVDAGGALVSDIEGQVKIKVTLGRWVGDQLFTMTAADATATFVARAAVPSCADAGPCPITLELAAPTAASSDLAPLAGRLTIAGPAGPPIPLVNALVAGTGVQSDCTYDHSVPVEQCGVPCPTISSTATSSDREGHFTVWWTPGRTPGKIPVTIEVSSPLGGEATSLTGDVEIIAGPPDTFAAFVDTFPLFLGAKTPSCSTTSWTSPCRSWTSPATTSRVPPLTLPSRRRF
jgi:hypothetical protein